MYLTIQTQRENIGSSVFWYLEIFYFCSFQKGQIHSAYTN